MLNLKVKRSLLAVLLVVALVFSFSIATFAEDVADQDIITEAEDSATADSSAVADDESKDSAEDDHDHDHEAEVTTPESTTTETTGKKGLTVGNIVSIAIAVVVVVLIAVYCIKNREKVGKFLRSLKSEFKKIVWSPWSQVRKNTLVVLVVVIACAIVIALLDFLFSRSITALATIF